MEEEKKYLLGEDGKPKLSLCKYDTENCCNCMTYSIKYDGVTPYRCAKCRATK